MVQEVILGVLDKVSAKGNANANANADTLFASVAPRRCADTKAAKQDLAANTTEALQLVRRGFAELGREDPEVAYRVVMDVLGGIKS